MVLVVKSKRPASIHSKRRSGQHHKRGPRYNHAYWPYLPMGVIVALGMLVNGFWGTIQQHVLGYATDMSVSSLLQETNNQRAGGGLAGLTLNTKLDQAAQAKANDMTARDYWSHNTPEGNPPWTFITNAGYSYQAAGENLAYGFDTSSETISGWMNSPGHRANIMNSGYKEVGFGIANASDYQGTGPETIVVAMYGSPQNAPAAPVAHAVPSAPTKKGPAPQATPTQASETPAPALQESNTTPAAAAPGTSPKQTTAATPLVASKHVSRIELLSGGTSAWSTFAVSAIATVSVAIFFLRHGLLLRRVLVTSEAFVHKHPLFDIALVLLATAGFVLSRTDGIIR